MIRLSILAKYCPIVFCSTSVFGIINSIFAICLPDTSANVEPEPTDSPYRFNSSVREKMKYESSSSLCGTMDWNPWLVQPFRLKMAVFPIPAREVNSTVPTGSNFAEL